MVISGPLVINVTPVVLPLPTVVVIAGPGVVPVNVLVKSN
jgi:hypothetical protein